MLNVIMTFRGGVSDRDLINYLYVYCMYVYILCIYTLYIVCMLCLTGQKHNFVPIHCFTNVTLRRGGGGSNS